jgi:hypothetical protein
MNCVNGSTHMGCFELTLAQLQVSTKTAVIYNNNKIIYTARKYIATISGNGLSTKIQINPEWDEQSPLIPCKYDRD